MSERANILNGLWELERAIDECDRCAMSLQGDSKILVDVGRRLRNITSDVKRVKESLEYVAKSQGVSVSQSVATEIVSDNAQECNNDECIGKIMDALNDEPFQATRTLVKDYFQG